MAAAQFAGLGCVDDGRGATDARLSSDGGIDASPGIDGPTIDAATIDAATIDAATIDAAVADSDAPDAMSCVTAFTVTVRDVSVSHADFESFMGATATAGLVETDLGADGKPVYALPGGSAVTTGPDAFFSWYHDVPGVNHTLSTEVTLSEPEPGIFLYENYAFFPIDDRGFGNEGYTHNFHFTTELHARFRYDGGEELVFLGEDDVWVFINGKLAIDLGGAHPSSEGRVDLDAAAGTLGIAVGNVYDLAIFHAERHTDQSVYTITTNIECFYPA